MGSIIVLTPDSPNIPLTRIKPTMGPSIIILKLDAQHTPINILDIQIDPLINSTNLVIKNIMHITLDSHVHPNMTINVSAPKVVHPNLPSLEVARPSKSIKHGF
jgi:hypothetical protein